MLAMTSTHAQRILAPNVRPAFGQFLMDWEPVIPTLFTLLLGVSLAISLGRCTDLAGWKHRQQQRALWLWLLSAALFFVHFGPQWPSLLFSTGILQCLGICVLAVSLCAPSGGLSLGIGGALFLAWMGMEGQGSHIDGLNQGSFPIFPYLPFALLAFGWVRATSERRWLRWVLAVSGGGATACLWALLGWGHLGVDGSGVVLNRQVFHFTRPHQGDGFTLAADLLRGVPSWPVELSFWHTQPRLALFLLAACGTAAFAISRFVRFCPKPFALLSLAGRHSLTYYVLHFAGLGAFLLLPAAWRAQGWSWLVGTLVTYTLGLGLFRIRESFQRKAIA